MAEEDKVIQPYYETAKLDKDYINRLKCHIVRNLDELGKICEVENKVVAFDTETTGLVYFKSEITGCSISFNGTSGFYVPLRHENEDGTSADYNLPFKESLDLIYNKLLKRNTILLYNSCYDLTMLGQELWQIDLPFHDIENINFLDVQCLVYHLEPEIKKNGLKWASRHFLGIVQPTFEQITGISKKSKTNKHFGCINPWTKTIIEMKPIELKGSKKKFTDADILHNQDCLELPSFESSAGQYAIFDSSCTYGLFQKLMPICEKMWKKHTKNSKLPYALQTDGRFARAMLFYKHSPISIDTDLMKSNLEKTEKRIEEVQKEIYEIAGEVFNIKSTPQKRAVFQRLGIDTGVETKTGMSVSVSAIKGIDHPIINLLSEYSSLQKRKSAYFEPLSQNSIGRINYKTCALSTGRLASGRSGSEQGNTYFSSISIQTLPKSKNTIYEAIKTDENTPETILGYKFIPRDLEYQNEHPNTVYVEGFVQEGAVRPCMCSPHHIYLDLENGETLDFDFDMFKAEEYCRRNNIPLENIRTEKSEDWYVVSTDFSAEELCLIANLSMEPSFVEPLLKGEDLHMCYSDDTQFLTKDGFKYYDEIGDNDLIAQYKDGNLEFVEPLGRYEGLSDKMIHIKNRWYTDLMVTPNHRMLCRTSYKNNWKVKEAKDLVGKQFLIPSECIYSGVERTEPFIFESTTIRGRTYNNRLELEPNAFIEFLGFFLGDGHAGVHKCKGGNSYRINLSQSKSKYLNYMLGLNEKLGGIFRVNSNEKTGITMLELSHISLCKWLIDNFVVSNNYKKIPQWIFGLSYEQRELFLQAFIKADGTKPKNKKGYQLYAYKKSLADSLATLATMNGYRTNIYPHKDTIYSSLAHREVTPCYCVGIHKEPHTQINKDQSVLVETKNTRVVCFTVPSSFLVVKRNDKISISGNSMAKKMFGNKYDFGTIDRASKKNLRKKAKAGNFGLAYRGSYKALSKEIPDENEALEVYQSWWKAMPIYKSWQNEKINEMMTLDDGDAINLYGRRRRLRPLLQTGNQSTINSAVRAACNHYIQSLGGDLIRDIMATFYEKYLKNGANKDEIKPLASIHDELAFCVRKDVAEKWIYRITEVMEDSAPKDFVVPLKGVPGVGPNLGFIFDFVFDRDEKGKIIEGTLHLKV